MSENSSPTTAALPIAVVGAGPIGLAAAAHLLERGLEPLVLEAGPSAASAVRAWGHVRLFSAWSELVDPAAARLLEPTGWTRPEAKRYPTGAEWAVLYLQPLADALGAHMRYNTTVTGAARRGRDRIVDSGREDQPFTLHTSDADGTQARLSVRAIIDATGTFTSPNPLGSDGLPAAGEHTHRDRITYLAPDTADSAVAARHAGRRTAVVGSGHSALTALLSLAELAKDEPGTRAVWVLRRGAVGNAFGGGESDELPARGALGLRAKEAVTAGHIEVVQGFRTERVEDTAGQLVLVADDGRRIEELDHIIGLTGFRPDHSWQSELRLTLDERLQAPVKLAPLIDPNQHSCGTVYPHGANELGHHEEGVYLVGMKSYGRAPTFLAMTGYEQVRSVAAALAGDHEAAARVELTLPDTGVCGGAGLFDDPDAAQSEGGCCAAPAPTLLSIGIGAPAPASGGC
ncbi:NAD(P)-binding domain-containing protein [Streptacidiphilus sp. P02-A3a]|uniref:NAD(P)-binding domain-containing protein n=1 Tax=Streptacidiphilus sp. P02-A3a TaxID=2704468 RepID=UPI0015FC7E1E|nr:NAD(P)-binding domain-containing protein [Streptacidiphilus sp. P02-A3a]QMU67096.1 NAD(P)-binding domain-containing protein [Streptacidiphilus sp. P02-A3a]